jgi:divalent metal cation (Fe/Co/Zn/Cd) transporter
VVVWVGFPIADPIVGLVITALIVRIVWDSTKSVFVRMLDGVDPRAVEEIAHVTSHLPGVLRVADVRARWLGHRMEVEVHVTVSPGANVRDVHALGVEIGHRLSHEMPFIANTTVHADPLGKAGIRHHHITAHEHDGLPLHAH